MENFFIILFAVSSLVTLVASFIFIRGLFPERVEKVRATLEAHWKRSFWLGFLNTILISIFVFGFGALANNSPVFYLPTFGIYGAFLIGLLFGLTAFLQILGERLFTSSSPIKRDIRAGAVFLLASLLPVVGWFLLFPYVISLGVGAVVLTIFQKKKSVSDSEPEK